MDQKKVQDPIPPQGSNLIQKETPFSTPVAENKVQIGQNYDKIFTFKKSYPMDPVSSIQGSNQVGMDGGRVSGVKGAKMAKGHSHLQRPKRSFEFSEEFSF